MDAVSQVAEKARLFGMRLRKRKSPFSIRIRFRKLQKSFVRAGVWLRKIAESRVLPKGMASAVLKCRICNTAPLGYGVEVRATCHAPKRSIKAHLSSKVSHGSSLDPPDWLKGRHWPQEHALSTQPLLPKAFVHRYLTRPALCSPTLEATIRMPHRRAASEHSAA